MACTSAKIDGVSGKRHCFPEIVQAGNMPMGMALGFWPTGMTELALGKRSPDCPDPFHIHLLCFYVCF